MTVPQFPQQPGPGDPNRHGATPSYPATASHAAPQPHPAQAPPPAPPSNGVGAWLQILWLALVPLIVVNQVSWVAASLVARANLKNRGPIAAQNANNSANFALTHTLVVTAAALIAIGVMVWAAATSPNGSVTGSDPRVWVYVAGLIVIVLGYFFAVVVGIVGAVKASKGVVFRAPGTIAFLAAPAPPQGVGAPVAFDGGVGADPASVR